jgi:hypothetical protein
VRSLDADLRSIIATIALLDANEEKEVLRSAKCLKIYRDNGIALSLSLCFRHVSLLKKSPRDDDNDLQLSTSRGCHSFRPYQKMWFSQIRLRVEEEFGDS